jgi:hypothetical protein
MSFSDKVDAGYRKHRNPYHNPNHAADVAQTTHFFICQTGGNFIKIKEELEPFRANISYSLRTVDENWVCSSIDVYKWLKPISGSKLAKNIITQACEISSACCWQAFVFFSSDFEICYTCGFVKTVLGLLNWLSEVEVFAMIFAAAIHDYEHTGTTNTFHTQTRCVWGDYFRYQFPFYMDRHTVTVSKLFIQML